MNGGYYIDTFFIEKFPLTLFFSFLQENYDCIGESDQALESRYRYDFEKFAGVGEAVGRVESDTDSQRTLPVSEDMRFGSPITDVDLEWERIPEEEVESGSVEEDGVSILVEISGEPNPLASGGGDVGGIGPDQTHPSEGCGDTLGFLAFDGGSEEVQGPSESLRGVSGDGAGSGGTVEATGHFPIGVGQVQSQPEEAASGGDAGVGQERTEASAGGNNKSLKDVWGMVWEIPRDESAIHQVSVVANLYEKNIPLLKMAPGLGHNAKTEAEPLEYKYRRLQQELADYKDRWALARRIGVSTIKEKMAQYDNYIPGFKKELMKFIEEFLYRRGVTKRGMQRFEKDTCELMTMTNHAGVHNLREFRMEVMKYLKAELNQKEKELDLFVELFVMNLHLQKMDKELTSAKDSARTWKITATHHADRIKQLETENLANGKKRPADPSKHVLELEEALRQHMTQVAHLKKQNASNDFLWNAEKCKLILEKDTIKKEAEGVKGELLRLRAGYASLEHTKNTTQKQLLQLGVVQSLYEKQCETVGKLNEENTKLKTEVEELRLEKQMSWEVLSGLQGVGERLKQAEAKLLEMVPFSEPRVKMEATQRLNQLMISSLDQCSAYMGQMQMQLQEQARELVELRKVRVAWENRKRPRKN